MVNAQRVKIAALPQHEHGHSPTRPGRGTKETWISIRQETSPVRSGRQCPRRRGGRAGSQPRTCCAGGSGRAATACWMGGRLPARTLTGGGPGAKAGARAGETWAASVVRIEHAQRQPAATPRPGVASLQLVGAPVLGRQDGLGRRLRVGADDQRLGHLSFRRQPVAMRAICRAAFWPSLPAQIQAGVNWPTVDTVEHRVVAAVEEVSPGCRSWPQVLGRGEQVACAASASSGPACAACSRRPPPRQELGGLTCAASAIWRITAGQRSGRRSAGWARWTCLHCPAARAKLVKRLRP